jgi:hypothetical protein
VCKSAIRAGGSPVGAVTAGEDPYGIHSEERLILRSGRGGTWTTPTLLLCVILQADGGGRLAFTRGAYIAGRCADGRRPVRGSFGGTANPALRSRGRGQCPRCFCASYYRPMGADDSRSRAGPSQLLGREHTKLLEPQRQLPLVRGRARLIFCRSHIDSPCWSERLLVVLATMDLAIAVVAGHGAALPSAMRAVAQLISR